MKFSALWVLCCVVSGCVMDAPAVHRDDTAKVNVLSEELAHKDLACAKVKVGRPVRSVRMTDGWEPLYTEYRTWVEGCGKHITYVIVCTDDDDVPCHSSDLEKTLLKE